jgi:hypothetical protein
MSKPTRKQITLNVKIKIEVMPGVDPAEILDQAVVRMTEGLDFFEARSRYGVTRARLLGNIRDAEITDVES